MGAKPSLSRPSDGIDLYPAICRNATCNFNDLASPENVDECHDATRSRRGYSGLLEHPSSYHELNIFAHVFGGELG